MLGFHIVEEMKKQGIEFITSSTTKPINHKLDKWFYWDLNNRKSQSEINKYIKGVDAIIHAGSIVPKNNKEIMNNNILDVNVRSTLDLSEYALKMNIPLCYISGSTVYTKKIKTKIKEIDLTSENGLGGFYGFSKYLSEKVINHFISKGLNAFILRPSSIYGFGQSKDKVVQKFLELAINNKNISITPPYDKKFNLIHASDVAKLCLKVLETKKYGTYNIGSSKLYTLQDIAKCCTKIVGSGNLILKKKSEKINVYSKIFNLDSSLIEKKFGVKKTLELDEGIKNILDYMKIYNSVI